MNRKKASYYLEDWDRAKGYAQPLPFAEGTSITLGVDDALARINESRIRPTSCCSMDAIACRTAGSCAFADSFGQDHRCDRMAHQA